MALAWREKENQQAKNQTEAVRLGRVACDQSENRNPPSQTDRQSGMAIAKTGHGGSQLKGINYNFYQNTLLGASPLAVRLAYSLAVVTGFALGSLRYA